MTISVSSLDVPFAYRANAAARDGVETSLERLATGKRINRGADDPSGLQTAEQLRSDLTSLNKKIDAWTLSITRHEAEEGPLAAVDDLLTDLSGLIVTASNGSALSDDERGALQIEVNSILDAIDLTLSQARHRGELLFKGLNTKSLGQQAVLVRAEDAEDRSLKVLDDRIRDRLLSDEAEDIREAGGDPREIDQDGDERVATTARLSDLRDLLSLDGDYLEAAREVVDSALGEIDGRRAAAGSRVNSLQSLIDGALVEVENLSSALSLIEDTDFAKETASLVRNQLLEETSRMAIMIGRQQAMSVLKLVEAAEVNGAVANAAIVNSFGTKTTIRKITSGI